MRNSKEWKESVMVGHTRMDERMDEKVSRDLVVGLTVKEAGEEGKDVLIVRLSREGHLVESGNDR